MIVIVVLLQLLSNAAIGDTELNSPNHELIELPLGSSINSGLGDIEIQYFQEQGTK